MAEAQPLTGPDDIKAMLAPGTKVVHMEDNVYRFMVPGQAGFPPTLSLSPEAVKAVEKSGLPVTESGGPSPVLFAQRAARDAATAKADAEASRPRTAAEAQAWVDGAGGKAPQVFYQSGDKFLVTMPGESGLGHQYHLSPEAINTLQKDGVSIHNSPAAQSSVAAPAPTVNHEKLGLGAFTGLSFGAAPQTAAPTRAPSNGAPANGTMASPNRDGSYTDSNGLHVDGKGNPTLENGITIVGFREHLPKQEIAAMSADDRLDLYITGIHNGKEYGITNADRLQGIRTALHDGANPNATLTLSQMNGSSPASLVSGTALQAVMSSIELSGSNFMEFNRMLLAAGANPDLAAHKPGTEAIPFTPRERMQGLVDHSILSAATETTPDLRSTDMRHAQEYAKLLASFPPGSHGEGTAPISAEPLAAQMARLESGDHVATPRDLVNLSAAAVRENASLQYKYSGPGAAGGATFAVTETTADKTTSVHSVHADANAARSLHRYLPSRGEGAMPEIDAPVGKPAPVAGPAAAPATGSPPPHLAGREAPAEIPAKAAAPATGQPAPGAPAAQAAPAAHNDKIHLTLKDASTNVAAWQEAMNAEDAKHGSHHQIKVDGAWGKATQHQFETLGKDIHEALKGLHTKGIVLHSDHFDVAKPAATPGMPKGVEASKTEAAHR